MYQVIGGEHDGKILTAREIAELVGATPDWVYKKITNGEFYWRLPKQAFGSIQAFRYATEKAALNPAALMFAAQPVGSAASEY